MLVVCPRAALAERLKLWGSCNKRTNTWFLFSYELGGGVSSCVCWVNLTLNLPASFPDVVIGLCHHAGHLGI